MRWRLALLGLLGMALSLGAVAQQQGSSQAGFAAAGPQVDLAKAALQEAVRSYGHRLELTRGMRVVLGQNCQAAEPCFSCVTCHGVRGEGDAGSGTPRLTGQSDEYLESQLRYFAAGQRTSSTMQPIARQLSPEDMRDVAEWYAAQTPTKALPVPVPGTQPNSAELASGGKLSAVGSAERRVQACVNCHGPAGIGEPPIFPYLAGQYPGYIEAQLEAFRQGTRAGDPLRVMQSIASGLTASDIEAVAVYFGSMQPPIHLRQRAVGAAARPEESDASQRIVGDPPSGHGSSDPPARNTQPGPNGTKSPTPNHGRLLAFGGQFGQLKNSCASCHQLDGTADPSGAFPRLAQQDARYLYQSLRDFASGARRSDVMQPIAKELSDAQMRSIAEFYSTLRPQPFPPSLPPDQAALSRGRATALNGASPGTAGCDSCHGANGLGVHDAFPYLAGQYANYLEQQLERFKSRQRRGPQASIMQRVASGLADQQIHDVSLYFASLRPREVATAGLLDARAHGQDASPK